ncbi:MAG: hypothetical protein IKE69_00335 [Thermoguttaceae bacterium]|nr:hypothetical protein [Thermoguttaceae bacterium]
MSATFTETPTVDKDGKISFSENFGKLFAHLGWNGDVTVSVEGNRIVMMDATLAAFKDLQEAMKGKAEEAGFRSEEEFDSYILSTPRIDE